MSSFDVSSFHISALKNPKIPQKNDIEKNIKYYNI